jgi:hypothetical protein
MSRLMPGLGFTMLMPRLANARTRGTTSGRLYRLFGKSRSCLRLARRPAFRPQAQGHESFESRIGLGADDLNRLSDRELLDRIRGRIRQDFAQGRVHLIDGWQVSATELAIIRNLHS